MEFPKLGSKGYLHGRGPTSEQLRGRVLAQLSEMNGSGGLDPAKLTERERRLLERSRQESDPSE